jgi:hypothetical protein
MKAFSKMAIRRYCSGALIALMLSSGLWAQGKGKLQLTLSMWGKAMAPFSSHPAARSSLRYRAGSGVSINSPGPARDIWRAAPAPDQLHRRSRAAWS